MFHTEDVPTPVEEIMFHLFGSKCSECLGLGGSGTGGGVRDLFGCASFIGVNCWVDY